MYEYVNTSEFNQSLEDIFISFPNIDMILWTTMKHCDYNAEIPNNYALVIDNIFTPNKILQYILVRNTI